MILRSFLVAAVLFPAVAVAGDDFVWEGPSFYGPGLDNRSNDNRRALAAVMWDDGNGPALYVGGNFRTAGGVEVNHIARWDGESWSSVGGGMTGEVLANAAVPGVYTLAVYEGDLIAAGNFTLAGGVPANHIARWDGVEWSPLGSGMGGGAPGEPPLVRELTVYNGDLIAGGDFPQAEGATVNFIARWDGGEWSALTGGSGTGVDGPVAVLSEYDGDLIVGGAYGMAGGMPASNIARWDGNEWSSLTSGVGGAPFGNFVNGLATFDGDLIVGGGFAQAGGVSANNVARWDGSSWSALGSGMNSNIQDLAVYDGGVIAGGLFSTAGGLPANGIARWDGSSWSAMGSGVSGLGLFNFVTDLLAADGELFAAGQFHEMDGVTTNNIARWDGASWSALGEPVGAWLNGPVTAATVYDGALIVAGTFSRAGGVAVNGIARWEGDGWSPLGAGVDAAITAFAVYNGDLFAAGSFTEAGGQAIAGVARWDGETWSALGDGVSNGVNLVRLRALAVYEGALIVGGQMTEAGGVPVNRIARWDGEAWSALGSGVEGDGIPVVTALAVYDGALIAGGSFTAAGGVPANHVAAWDGETWAPLGDGMTQNGRVEALAAYGDELIAAGNYIEDGFLKQVVRWDGSTWTPLDPDVSGAFVSTLTVVGDDLFAAGEFDQAGGVALNNVARWDGSTWSPLAGPVGPGTDAVVRAITAFDFDGPGPMPEKLVAGGGFVLTGGVVNWYLGIYGPQDLLPPVLAFVPPSLDFDEVPVGATSPPQTATLHNIGDADATGLIFSGLPENGFDADTSACDTTLPAGESCAVTVTFTPQVPGPAAATLHVDSNEGAVADLALSGNGIGEGEGPIADISPEAFEFTVPVGGSDTQILNVGNIGDAPLDWGIEEAESGFTRQGAPYRYGLTGAPEFHAPMGSDRASGVTRSRSEAPADRQVLPAPQPVAVGELVEGFDDITGLPGAGWALINNSEPVGPSSWFQGNKTIFPSHEGDADAYIAANFESTDDSGDISNWLLTPEVAIVNGTQITFWTRTSEQFEEFFDRLEVRMSVEGDSTDVGETAESVGDFTELLLTINPDLEPGEFPEEWTEFVLTVRGRSRQPVTGRFAFRYWVTDAGPDGSNGDYIGIDTVSVTQPGDVPAGCANPADIPWLVADPDADTTPPGGTVPVDVAVDATDLEEGEHTAQLCVTTNDPNAPLVEIQVHLTVTGGGGTEQHDVLLVSRASGADGEKGNDFSIGTPASDDNRFIAFLSAADNLHPDDPDGGVFNEDVYVRDLETHELILASRASGKDGEKANGGSSFLSLSADGRHVAFLAAATNLDPDAPLGNPQVYSRDLETHETRLVSRASGPDGDVGNDNSFDLSNSADGHFVAFESVASNLSPDDNDPNKRKIFVRDLETHETLLVSRANGADGSTANQGAQRPAISDDGRYVAFDSWATNLHPDASTEVDRIYVRNLKTHETILVSRASGPDGEASNAQSCCAAISADGRYVVYDSAATNIHPEATDGTNQVYARDLQTHETILVSRASGQDGAVGNDRSFVGQTGGGHWISSDGRHVIFLSEATNLHPDDTDSIRDTFVRDLWTHETVLVSRAAGAAGEKGNDGSVNAMLSPDGRYALLTSRASNLHPDDTDPIWDIFVRDLLGPPDLIVTLDTLDFEEVPVDEPGGPPSLTLSNVER